MVEPPAALRTDGTLHAPLPPSAPGGGAPGGAGFAAGAPASARRTLAPWLAEAGVLWVRAAAALVLLVPLLLLVLLLFG